jgi:hypothetical protein
MAVEPSHAAKRHETFSVEVVCADGPTTVLASGVPDFLDAVDRAMEWVEREDPTRAEPRSVGIFSSAGGRHEQVWGYPTAAPSRAGAGESRRLLEIFGFDPVAWRPPIRPVEAARPAQGPRPASPPLATFAAAAVDPDPEGYPAAAPPLRRRARSTSESLRQEVRTAWADRVSRSCLVLAAVSLWLTLTLLEPAFLVLFVAAAASVWSRRGRIPAPASPGLDDSF